MDLKIVGDRINKLIFGNEEELPLERKTFMLITFLSAIILVTATFTNILLDMNTWLIVLTIVATVILGTFYVFSRFTPYYKYLIIPLFISVIILLTSCWIYNAGYDSSNMLFVIAAFLGMFTIVPNKYRQIVFLVFLTFSSGLITLQYFFPNLVIPYDNDKQRFADVLLGNIIYITFIYLIIYLIIKNYIAENKKTFAVNVELSKRNEEISETIAKLQEIQHELTIAKERAEESDRLKSAF